jgi:glutamate 5-kinase
MAGGAASELSRGGMQTKIEAGKIATSGGAHMVIADGRENNPVGRIARGEPCTWFLTPSSPVTARKKWIAGSLAPQGVVTIDDGAARALSSGASLLPAGVTAVEGDFSRGDSVIVRDARGGEIGRGLVGYDVGMARKVIGRNSRHIAGVLGVEGRTEMIHRDDLVLAGDIAE